MVLDLSSNKRVDIELLDKILQKFEDQEGNSNSDLSSSDVQDVYNNPEELNPDYSLAELPKSEAISAETREIEFLLDMLGNILQQVSIFSYCIFKQLYNFFQL